MTKDSGFYPPTPQMKADFTGMGPVGLLVRPLTYEDAWMVFNDLHAQRVVATPILSQHQRALLQRALAEVLRARKAGVDGAYGAPVEEAPERPMLACSAEACGGSGWVGGRACMRCGGTGMMRNPKVPRPDPFALDSGDSDARVPAPHDAFALDSGGPNADPFAI